MHFLANSAKYVLCRTYSLQNNASRFVHYHLLKFCSRLRPRHYLINLLQTSVRQVDILCTPKQSKCSLHESETHFFMVMMYGSPRTNTHCFRHMNIVTYAGLRDCALI
jgi:hypothetical protein